MSNDKLPIKFFAPREVDEQRVEPAPSNAPSNRLLKGEELQEHAKMLVSELDEFFKIVKKKETKNSPVPYVFTAQINKDFTAKSHRKEIVNLFSYKDRTNVIGLSEADELIVKVDNITQMQELSNRISNFEKNNYAISCIENLYHYTPIVNEKMEKSNYKVKLLNYQDYELNSSMQRYFEQFLRSREIIFKKTAYTKNEFIYNIKNIQNTQLDCLLREEAFETLFSIEPMPRYSLALDFLPSEDSIKIKKPLEGVNYAIVGILDSGISRIPYLEPWLEKDKWSVYPPSSIDNEHGTFVAGVALYGDDCENKNWVGHSGIRLFDATVFPDTNKEGIEEDELISNIREAISENYKNIKIWNLSISITRQICDDKFSDFAIALDALQDEYNVLICKSAGNCNNFITNHPKGRLNEGADSVRSLVVGSVAHEKGKYDYAEIDNPSPFSRIGPGPEYIIKPELVHYGGNAGVDNAGKLVTTGVNSFATNGSLVQSVGTSFSTPRIASLAAGITQELNEDFDPLLIKALMVHSATYSENLKVPVSDRTKQMGYGIPKNVRDIIYNAPHEATLILRESLSKGEYIDIMDFPMPPSLIKDGLYTGQVIATLVYDPILDSSQGVEYCQSNIDIKFGSYDTKTERDTSKRNILNPVGRENPKNLLLPGIYSSKKIKNAENDFALKERLLIQYADKYYPVKKYAIDFSEMTDRNKLSYLGEDKNWFLYIKGLYRDHITRQAANNHEQLNQEFCLILTIRDPLKQSNVYDEVTQKLDEYNFYHTNIKLSQNINIVL